MLRKYYWILIDGVMANDTKVYQKAEKLAKSEHVNHCFDYIRQGIMCAGDMSIEWPRVEPDGRRFAVDGWGIPHECKSWVSSPTYATRLRTVLTTHSGRNFRLYAEVSFQRFCKP